MATTPRLMRVLGSVPVPLFGNARTAAVFSFQKAKQLPKFAGWLGPLGASALWFVWPAVDDGWKIEVGIMADPVAAAEAASLASAKNVVTLTKEEKLAGELFAKAVETGDFTYLEEKWETKMMRSMNPEEDDDEEDEDDDGDDDDDDGDEDDDDDE